MQPDDTFIRLRLNGASIDVPGDLRAAKKALEDAQENRNPWLAYGGVVFHIGRVIAVEDSTDLIRSQVKRAKEANAVLGAIARLSDLPEWDALMSSLPDDTSEFICNSLSAYMAAPLAAA